MDCVCEPKICSQSQESSTLITLHAFPKSNQIWLVGEGGKRAGFSGCLPLLCFATPFLELFLTTHSHHMTTFKVRVVLEICLGR